VPREVAGEVAAHRRESGHPDLSEGRGSFGHGPSVTRRSLPPGPGCATGPR
jgi:hypothetical protein